MRNPIDLNNTYDLLQEACSTFDNEIALTFIPDVSQYKLKHEFTYSALFQAVNQTIRAFESYGLKSSDTISWILPNCPEAYFCYWAAEAVGVNNPISPEYSLEYIAGT